MNRTYRCKVTFSSCNFDHYSVTSPTGKTLYVAQGWVTADTEVFHRIRAAAAEREANPVGSWSEPIYLDLTRVEMAHFKQCHEAEQATKRKWRRG